MHFRSIILSFCLLLLIAVLDWPQVKQFAAEVEDRFDSRPELRVLFLGNSRTFANDMPQMVRRIADSAHSAQKYEITMHAPGGVRLEDHWASPEVQALLNDKWDDVVLQGRSNEQTADSAEASFRKYGQLLIDKIKSGGATPVLYVMWRYADDDEIYKVAPWLKTTLHQRIQQSYAGLAQRAGAQLVNVGDIWEKVRRAAPEMRLYADTNHPNVKGSYLVALMFYRFFSHDDLNHVTYVPDGVSPQEAELLRTAAQSW